MGQTASAILSGHVSGTCVLQQAAKGDIDLGLIAADPLLLLYTNRAGQNLAHVAARAGLLRVLELLITLLSQYSDVVAAAVRTSLEENDAKQAGVWWKASKALPWLRAFNAQQLLDLQTPAMVARTVLSWQSSRGVTPLMLACRSGHAQCVSMLLDHGADPLLLDNTTRRSCLHYAAATGYASCISVLLNEFRTVAVLQDNSGMQHVLLQDAVLRDGGQVWVMCKFVDLRTSTGFGALHYATFWGHTKVVRALLAAGASVMLQTANGVGRPSTELMVDRGNTPLHLAADNGHVMTAATLLTAHAETMSRRFPASLRQHQQQPWEGQPRQDPRAALNINKDTPLALAIASRRSKELMLLLDPRTPLLMLLQSAGLLDSGLFGVPKLSALAKRVLDQHLSTCLGEVEAVQQQRAVEAATAAAAMTAAADAAALASAEEEEDTFALDDVTCTGADLLACADASHATALPEGDEVIETAAADHEQHALVQDSSIPNSGTRSIGLGAFCSRGLMRPSSSASSLAGVLCSSSTPAVPFDSSRNVDTKFLPSLWDGNFGSSNGSALATLADDISDSSSSSGNSSTCYDTTCNICFDQPSGAILAGCGHKMCVCCARMLVAATSTVRPAVCPFCRLGVSGFLPALHMLPGDGPWA